MVIMLAVIVSATVLAVSYEQTYAQQSPTPEATLEPRPSLTIEPRPTLTPVFTEEPERERKSTSTSQPTASFEPSPTPEIPTSTLTPSIAPTMTATPFSPATLPNTGNPSSWSGLWFVGGIAFLCLGSWIRIKHYEDTTVKILAKTET